VVPERSIGGSFADEPLTQFGFYWDWKVARSGTCAMHQAIDEPRKAKSKVEPCGSFLASDDKVLVCTHATFPLCGGGAGHQAFDNRLIAIDEFHHVSSNPDNKLGSQLGAFIARQGAYGGDDRAPTSVATARRCWPRRTNPGSRR
jgi:hypothetical protein